MMKRFGITADAKSNSVKEEMSEEERQRLLKRKERFGEVTSTVINNVSGGSSVGRYVM